jgi:acyl-CoA reductase-like NAD-dependent aldehyde dehydrogenase
MAKSAGLVNRHYHPHEVFAYTISGKWGYLEHDWTATAGAFVYETPGEAHTLVAYESDEPMKVHFKVKGPLIWLDEDGEAVDYFDVHDYIDICKEHYERLASGQARSTRCCGDGSQDEEEQMTTVDLEQQRLLIGGEWVEASGGGTFERSDPLHGKAVTVAAAAGREDVRRAVEAARDAFPAWSGTPAGERRALLTRAADVLMERAPDVAGVMTEEVGGTFGWGMFNCDLASRMLREAAAQAYSVVGEVIPSDVPGSLAMGVRQPAGVVVGMAPWNAPVILSTRAVAMPLAYGNTVVLKASERCPRTHAAVIRALVDAGLPAGAINLIIHAPGDAPDVVDELIAHPAVRRVNFTGSTRVGRIVALKCAEHLKRSLLELGGKAPQVVLADADLDAAADAASFGAFMNSGQICMSTERIVADRSIAAELGSKLAERAGKLTVGDPRDQRTMIGPVITDDARERIVELIEDARAKGAEVLSGGDSDGNLVTPTVLAGVTPEMRIYGEESFGPVVSIVAVDGADEAVRVANDTEYGLAAAVFGADVDAAMAVARRIESGICHVNSSTVHDEPQMPFGGVKSSGWGRFGGRAALEEFTELRWMTVQQAARHYPI